MQNDKLKEANETLKIKIEETEKEVTKLNINETTLAKAYNNSLSENESLKSRIKELQIKKMDTEATKKASQKEIQRR